MKKLPDSMDNPIDVYLVRLFDNHSDFFKKTGHTPNILTTYSLIFGLLSCYFLNIKSIVLFSIFYTISYFFDCADGHFARKYNMTSKFGDIYDHTKDILVGIIILYITFKNSSHNITPVTILLLIVFIFLAVFHLSCQENNCNDEFKDKDNGSLKLTRSLCKKKENIKWSRFFGTGTFNLFFIILIVYINRS